MLQPGRHANTGDYRYGFQGQEMDDEVKGEGNSINYKYRMHDPRVGRFFAVDPLFKSYPWNSPYAFSENRVIDGIDLEGAEFAEFMTYAKAGMYGKTVQKIVNGLDKSATKTKDGIVFVAQNPDEALKGMGNFALGIGAMGVAGPYNPVQGQQNLQYIDAKFGTTTYVTMIAFEQSMSESADKLINGDLEDRTEIITDLISGILGAKGVDKALRVGKLSLTATSTGKIIIRNINKVVNGIRADRMLVGKSDKIAIIGRGQENRVNKFAQGIEAETGVKVETWKGFDVNLSQAENLANNKKWVQKLKDEGYTVYDVGTGPKSPDKGAYYGMETKELFGDK